MNDKTAGTQAADSVKVYSDQAQASTGGPQFISR